MQIEQILQQPKVYEIYLYQKTSGYVVEENNKYYIYITLQPSHKLYTEDIQTINYNYGLNLTYDVLDNTVVRRIGYWYEELDKERMKKDLDNLSERLF